MKSKRKILTFYILIGTILLVAFTYGIASNINEDARQKQSEEKISYEIQTLSKQLMELSNQLNNQILEWQQLEKITQELYLYWSSAILDFNMLEIDKNSLTGFGKNIDQLMIHLKNRNIENARISILSLYQSIAVFSDNLEDKAKTELVYAQYYLLNANSFVEQGNWTVVQDYILKSDEHLSKVVNDIKNTSYHPYNLHQAYIALKELENTIYTKDKDIFYWKYTIAIDKLNML